MTRLVPTSNLPPAAAPHTHSQICFSPLLLQAPLFAFDSMTLAELLPAGRQVLAWPDSGPMASNHSGMLGCNAAEGCMALTDLPTLEAGNDGPYVRFNGDVKQYFR